MNENMAEENTRLRKTRKREKEGKEKKNTFSSKLLSDVSLKYNF